MASIKNITLSIVSVLLKGGTMKEVEVQHIVNLTLIDGKIQTIISTATNSVSTTTNTVQCVVHLQSK